MFTGVLAISALTIVSAVTKRIVGGSRHVRVTKGDGRTVIGVNVGSGDTDPGRGAAMADLAAEFESLRDEVTGLRRELDEAQNRLDFTERMLAQARERGQLPGPQRG